MSQKTISRINFNVLQEEAIRQFDEQSNLLKSHAHLAEVLIGFVLFFFVYFLKDLPTNLNFYIPIFLILIAGALGSYAFWLRDFPIGMEVDEAKNSILENKELDLRAERLNKIIEANKINKRTIKRRSLLLKTGYAFYFIGFIEFFIVKFIYLHLYQII